MSNSFEGGPAWLEGETFFSLCSRVHLRSTRARPRETSERLFQLSERSIKHDLPCGLDNFDQITAGRWGDPLQIIENHTIFPFFAPFQSRVIVDTAISRFRSPVLGSLKYQLGLVCGGFGADHPLKACKACMKHDIDVYGVSYWHLQHQYPGVVICPTHLEALVECTRNHRWCGRFGWTLPDHSNLRDAGYGEISPLELQRTAELAIACCDLAQLGLNHHFEPLTAVKAYRQQMPTQGAVQSFLAHVGPLNRFRPYTNIPNEEAAGASFIDQMTRSPRRHVHPLKHLMMITWLFDDLASFAGCYNASAGQGADPLLFPGSPLDPPLPVVTSTPQEFKRGAPRPKRLKADLRLRLLDKLAGGASKLEVCEEFKITVSTVNKLLRTERSVKESWAAHQAADALADHRLRWTDLRDRFPLLSVSELRGLCPGLYAWLYRNDRKWLDAQSAETPRPIRHHSRIDWDMRDDRLKGQLREAVIRRYGTDQNLRLRQTHIYALIPRLAQRLERRDRYPKTRGYMNLISISQGSLDSPGGL